MEKKKLVVLVSGLTLAIVIGAIFLVSSGVPGNKKAGSQTPPQPPSSSQQWQPGENNNGSRRLPPMNISDEERQQMMEARMQTAITACHDKVEGDACTMTAVGPRGNATGTCKTQNGNLTCSIAGMTRGSNRSSVTAR